MYVEYAESEMRGRGVPIRSSPEHGVPVTVHVKAADLVGDRAGTARIRVRVCGVGHVLVVAVSDEHATTGEMLDGFLVATGPQCRTAPHGMADHDDRHVAEAMPHLVQREAGVHERVFSRTVPAA